MRPRVAAAELSHETNVFSAVPTDLAAFRASGLSQGDAIVQKSRNTNSSLGGFLTGAAELDFDLLPVLSVWATPSGLVTAEAIETLEAMLADGLRRARAGGPLAGVLLALHGAMVTAIDDDGDAHVLELVRAVVGPDVPIVATLDLHANISPRMLRATDLLIGYDTYPHVDMAIRAHEACGLLARLIRREIRPTPALVKPPMLPTSQNMPTDRDPMKSLIAHAHTLESDHRVLNVTVAGGFPPADVADAGLSVLVTTNGDQPLAERLAAELALDAWSRRDGFLGGVASFAEAAAAIHALRADPAGPLVLVDIGDNPWTGGPGDSAELLRFLSAERVTDVALALIADPESVARCRAAGPGATVDLELGGKTDRLHGEPFPCRGYVRLLSDGRYLNDGPMMAGLPVDLGPTALVVVDGVEVLVTTRAETPIDLNVFRAHGIEPTRRRVLALKGKGHFRAAFAPIASDIILVEGPGITGADLSRLSFQKIRRPIWPLDQDVSYP
jgi:microcystin degradation protein MlrC